MAAPTDRHGGFGRALRTTVSALVALAVLVAATATAPADVDDRTILGDPSGWRIEQFDLRLSYLDQNGRGFQSQDGAAPGSEEMRVIQPGALVTIRQSDRVVHRIAMPFDAITAASPDAVDATTSASRNNIAGDLDVRTSIKLSEVGTLLTRVTAHGEEWLGGGTIGAGYKRALADDNASITITGSFGLDGFDQHDHFGSYLGKTYRATTNLSIAASQLLSPTTVVDGSYGATYQHGALDTGWNAVPLDNGNYTDEKFPRGRLRHVLTAGIAQHLPRTRSTARARYRFYGDDFGLIAHSVEGRFYQYVVPWLYVTASYRFHRQNGVDFFTTAFPVGMPAASYRTADSDLAPFTAHQFAVGVTTVRGRGPLRKWALGGELLRYGRSNDLRIIALTITAGRVL